MNNGKKPRLLLADDSVTIRKVVEMTFASEGIEVDAVGDAQSAMDSFVELQPDIVLVDTDLPGTNGYQMCEMIKRDESTRDIPVLLLVGSFEPFDHAAAERAGADGHLTKPFHSIRDLVTRVSDLLRKQDVQPPPETNDIDHLYENSFSGEAEIDTVDDLLGDAGLDDQLIETSSHNGSDNGLDSLVVFETETSESTFDWSPEAIVSQSVPDESPVAFEPRFTFAENDVEAPAAEAEQELAEVIERAGNVEPPPAVEPFIRITDDPAIDEERTRTEETPETVSLQEPFQTEEIPEALYVSSPEPVQAEETSQTTSVSSQEPSPELVELVVNQVMEKLSDRVIREIAQEAVPRIAEKLMREALDRGQRKEQT